MIADARADRVSRGRAIWHTCILLASVDAIVDHAQTLTRELLAASPHGSVDDFLAERRREADEA